MASADTMEQDEKKRRKPPPPPCKPTIQKPDAPPKPKPVPREKPKVPCKPSSTSPRPQHREKPPVPAKPEPTSQDKTEDSAVKEMAKEFLMGKIGHQIKRESVRTDPEPKRESVKTESEIKRENTRIDPQIKRESRRTDPENKRKSIRTDPDANSMRDQDNNDISDFPLPWENKSDSEKREENNGNKEEEHVIVENENVKDIPASPEMEETETAATSKDKKGRKRSAGTGIFANIKARFSSGSKDVEDEKKKKSERKKSVEKQESIDSGRSKFYVLDSEDKNTENLESSSSTFYTSNNTEELSHVKTNAITQSPVLPPKNTKRKSYHEQLVEKGLTPMEIDIEDKKPTKPVRRKKKKGLFGATAGIESDMSSTESLLDSDHSGSSRGQISKLGESQDDDTSVSKSDKDTDKSPDTEKSSDTSKSLDQKDKEEATEKSEPVAIRQEKKRNVWNKDVFKSFTTDDMDIFHPRKSEDLASSPIKEEPDPNTKPDPEPKSGSGDGKTQHNTAPVTIRSRDPLRNIKQDRRRSKSIGASPAMRPFGIALKSVAKPKVAERPGHKPPPPPLGRPKVQPPPPPPAHKTSAKPTRSSKTASLKTPVDVKEVKGVKSDSKGNLNKQLKDLPVDKDDNDNQQVSSASSSSLSSPSPPPPDIPSSSSKGAKTPDFPLLPTAPCRKHKKPPPPISVVLRKPKEPEPSETADHTNSTVDLDTHNIYDNNLDAGVVIDDDSSSDSAKSPGGYYEEIQFSPDQKVSVENKLKPQKDKTKTEKTDDKHEETDLATKKTDAKHEETVKDESAMKKNDTLQIPSSQESLNTASSEEHLYGNVFVAPGQGMGKEIKGKSSTKVSRKVSRKVSVKLTRKLTQRVKERNLDQSLVKQFLREESLEAPLDDFERDAVAGAGAADEPLHFSDDDTDSEFDDEFESEDESDIEWEQEIMAKLEARLTQTEKKEDSDHEKTPEEKLRNVAQELLNTEKAYVERLHLVDQVFHFRVIMENRNHHMFPEEVLPQMFSNIKSIYQFHHDFLLPQLEKRMDKWDEIPRIGDVMKSFAPFLKLYSEYVKNYSTGMDTISSWQVKSPRFFSIMDEIQKTPECGHLTLQHHMLEPIQRVPRYEMLLKAYLKHLPEGSADFQDTEAALHLVSTAAKHNNESMSKSDKFRKMLEINESLGGGIDLTSPTRELFKEGRIIKVSPRNGAQQERYIFLFNDMLLVCQSVPALTMKTQYRVRNKLDVEGMQVLEGDNLELPDTFYIKSKMKTIEVHCKSIEEKVEWQMALWSVINDFVKKKMSRKIALAENFPEEDFGKAAPKWIKDQETTMCMICSQSFSTFRRRHHCRACGSVVCGKCSSHKTQLAFTEQGKMSRVCDKCHVQLMEHGQCISAPTLVEGTGGNVGGNQRKRGILQVKATEKGLITGYLHMSLDKKTWMKRYFVIHKDFVLYCYKAHQDVVAMTSLPLPGYVVSEATENDHLDRSNVFKLTHHQQKAYYFQTDNDRSIIKRWIYIMECVTQAELPEEGRSASNSAAPGSLPTIPAPTSPNPTRPTSSTRTSSQPPSTSP